MKFNSQICTTKEQSKRLLALGLKKKTADMYHTTFYRDNVLYKMIRVRNEKLPLLSQDLPAWSLHRLIELSDIGIIDSSTDNIWDKIIQYIEFLIKCGDFNKEYLEEKK